MSAAHRRALSCGALLVATAVLVPVQQAQADPVPGPSSRAERGSLSEEALEDLLRRLQTLYRRAEEATEDYKAAREKLQERREAVEKLEDELADQHAEVRRKHREAGALARRQYMGGGLSDYSRLLLAQDPHGALQEGHLMGRAAAKQAETLRRLKAGERDLGRLAKAKRKARDAAAGAARSQRAARDRVKERLGRVEKLVSSLTGAELEELRDLERRGLDAAQAEFLRSGALGTGVLGPSKAGQRALAYAFAQVGEPYVWGAEGPDAFDCSGLTSQAWLHAGRSIPRTSQEQWKQLPRVPLKRMRPGDLVVYFPGATHVGMYIGQGLMVHAPRPGARVTVAPVGGMPVLGAVRPDPKERSAGGYRLPAAATRPAPSAEATRVEGAVTERG